MNTINNLLIKSEYHVRSGIVIRSDELKYQLDKGIKQPFKILTPWNIGNPQGLGQLPISFPREVLSCFLSNIKDSDYNKDAVRRSNTYKTELNNINAYTNFKGLNLIRNNIASFISNRDSSEVGNDDIILCNGASGGIKLLIQTFCDNKMDTFLTPVPQYPLYNAILELNNATSIGYYLNEDNDWTIEIDEMQELYRSNYDKGYNIKALVVINPGNPTGQLLSEEKIKKIVEFCYNNKLLIIADEVYENNIYSQSKKFHSFRKIISQLPPPYNKTMLFTLNSVSKGYFGE
jgi:alanine transaminase